MALRKIGWLGLVKKALLKDYLLELHGYCDNNQDNCPAREVSVRLKDHDATLQNFIRAGAPHCPLCGSKLLLGWQGYGPVETSKETDVRTCKEAALAINIKMLEQEQGEGPRFLCAREFVDPRNETVPGSADSPWTVKRKEAKE